MSEEGFKNLRRAQRNQTLVERIAAHLAGAHFWPAPDGQDITAEPSPKNLTTWTIYWTDGEHRKRIGTVELVKRSPRG
jgi:hypothetical protein